MTNVYLINNVLNKRENWLKNIWFENVMLMNWITKIEIDKKIQTIKKKSNVTTIKQYKIIITMLKTKKRAKNLMLLLKIMLINWLL